MGRDSYGADLLDVGNGQSFKLLERFAQPFKLMLLIYSFYRPLIVGHFKSPK